MMDRNAIPVMSADVISRADASGFLLFQIRTDEMHLVSASGHAIWSRCDGTRTVEELIGETAPDCPAEIETFLEALATRSLIEIWT